MEEKELWVKEVLKEIESEITDNKLASMVKSIQDAAQKIEELKRSVLYIDLIIDKYNEVRKVEPEFKLLLNETINTIKNQNYLKTEEIENMLKNLESVLSSSLANIHNAIASKEVQHVTEIDFPEITEKIDEIKEVVLKALEHISNDYEDNNLINENLLKIEEKIINALSVVYTVSNKLEKYYEQHIEIINKVEKIKYEFIDLIHVLKQTANKQKDDLISDIEQILSKYTDSFSINTNLINEIETIKKEQRLFFKLNYIFFKFIVYHMLKKEKVTELDLYIHKHLDKNLISDIFSKKE